MGYDPSSKIFGKYTIDRIDNNGNYCPENCRVISIQEQAYNKSTNRVVNYNGKDMTFTEAAELAGTGQKVAFSRLAKGWSEEEALSTPLKRTKLYTVIGISKSIKGWAEYLGTTDATIRGRLRNQSMQEIVENWSEEDRNKEKVSTYKFITISGETHHMKEWAKVLGITFSALRWRLKKHSLEEIVLSIYPNFPSTTSSN